MKLDEFADHLEARIRTHLEEVCSYAASKIVETTPIRRKLTRAAVRARVQGNRGSIGLRFREKYATRGTATLRRLEQQWRSLRPQLRKDIIRRINETLKGN
jgi:hypothetical protein